eukprot:752665-Hanusia_phi.AAC.5
MLQLAPCCLIASSGQHQRIRVYTTQQILSWGYAVNHWIAITNPPPCHALPHPGPPAPPPARYNQMSRWYPSYSSRASSGMPPS